MHAPGSVHGLVPAPGAPRPRTGQPPQAVLPSPSSGGPAQQGCLHWGRPSQSRGHRDSGLSPHVPCTSLGPGEVGDRLAGGERQRQRVPGAGSSPVTGRCGHCQAGAGAAGQAPPQAWLPPLWAGSPNNARCTQAGLGPASIAGLRTRRVSGCQVRELLGPLPLSQVPSSVLGPPTSGDQGTLPSG